MRGRQGTSWIAEAASDRLGRLAQQWRPLPSAPLSDVPPEAAAAVTADDAWRRAAVPPDDVGGSTLPALRIGPWHRPAVRALATVVILSVAVAAWWAWSGRPRELVVAPSVVATGPPLTAPDASGRADPGSAAPSARASVVVHVVGQVKRPGVVTLPAGSRVADAVESAGGVAKKGADDSVNLARILVDGEQVIVGFGAQAVAGALGIAPAATTATLVNLNAADAGAFEQLPGVGPVLAERIVQWRSANGPFRSVDELGEVSGIGDAIMGQIRPLVTV
jgi:competence protein ComEA